MILMAERYATGGLSNWGRKFSVVLKFFSGTHLKNMKVNTSVFKKERKREGSSFQERNTSSKKSNFWRNETLVFREVVFLKEDNTSF